MGRFTILKLMYVISFLNGPNPQTFFLIVIVLCGLTAGLMVSQKSDFLILTVISAGLYITSELLVDFDVQLLSLYEAAFMIGKISFCFMVGLMLGALIRRLIRRNSSS